MQDGTTLDPEIDLGEPAQLGGRRRHAVVLGAALAAVLLLIATVIFGPRLLDKSAERGEIAVRVAPEQLRAVAAMTVDDKAQILVEGLAAQQKNAEIPVSALPVEAVRGFKFGVIDNGAYATALQCLSQAVYYEAAHEPLTGRRAVAQVVLNRMRHPAYPNSVCGVVYQGSERRTGCQFSFTCDGALLRSPAARLWGEAQEVARQALAGYVEPSVGTATHYHADYVLPKWAFNLGKIGQLGRHIFYRFNGGMGRSLAFKDSYSGLETIPQMNLAALQLRIGDLPELTDPALLVTPGLTVAPAITDRHAPADVGGRLDVTKPWRLNIPDPVAASSKYRQAIAGPAPEAAASPATGIAAAEPKEPEVRP